MEGDTDFKVSTTAMTSIFEVEQSVSEFYDLHCEPDGGATGITDTFTFGHVLAGAHWRGLNVTNGIGLSTTTRKPITVTSVLNVVAEANEIAGFTPFPEGGGWVVFNRTNSNGLSGYGADKCSWTGV